MDLRRKLERLRAGSPTPPASDKASRLGDLRRMIHETTERHRAKRSVREAREPLGELPAPRVDTPQGVVHIRDQYLEPHHFYGSVRIAEALTVVPTTLAMLGADAQLEGVDPRRLMFVDTETTGLAGGTGTIPFLIGMAWFEGESLRVQQLLLDQPGNELPMLHIFAERLEASSALVTFNGKSFDWPLLRTRLVLYRMKVDRIPPHLDMLHCARRVYRRRLDSVRLVELERHVLGAPREVDIDGAEIPGIYFEYLRTGHAAELARVLEHNEKDLIALAAVLARMGHRLQSPRTEDEPEDHLGFASVAERGAQSTLAFQLAVAAAEGGGETDTTFHALLVAARIARKWGDNVSAEEHLLRALGCAPDDEALATVHLLLAKLLEHRCKDPARALEHALHTVAAEGEEANQRRIARLQRTMLSQSDQSAASSRAPR